MPDLGSVAFSGSAAVLAAGIALLTLTRRPGGALNRSCAALFAVLAVSHVGAALGERAAGLAVWIAAEAWVPALALWFGLQLARARGTGDRRVLLWMGAAGAAFGAVVTVVAFGLEPTFAPAPDGLMPLPPFGKSGIALALLIHIAALIQLENVYRAAQGQVRYRIKYVILGVAAILAVRVYVLSLAALYAGFDPGADLELAAATWLGGGMVAYAVVRHRLLDVDIFISRYVIYNSIAVAGTGAYLLLVGLMVYGLSRAVGALPMWLVPSVVMVALLGLGVLLLSDAARWRVRHFVDRNFYKNRHDYRIQWQAVSRAVAAEHSVEGFLSALAGMARETLGARYAGTLLKEAGAERYLPHPEGAYPGAAPVREADLKPDPNPAWTSPAGPMEVYRNTASGNDVLYLPLRFGDERIGLVALGPRIAGGTYHLEDLELVNAMAAQTAVAVRNLQLAQDLARSRETAALHQLSTFFIHDMKNVTNQLGLLARNIQRNRENPDFWADAEAGIGQAVAQMGQLTERLKELRENPEPVAARPVDLAELLAAWCREWGPSVTARVECRPDGPLPCTAAPDQLKSVFTNLVMNAAEAGASRVELAGGAEDGQVWVHVTDDGPGMEPLFVATGLFAPFVSTKPEGMGIGLFQSRRLVEQMGGQLTAVSRPGEGSRFTVTLPSAGAPAPAAPPPTPSPDTAHG
jgi:signal transduction histidine kinase